MKKCLVCEESFDGIMTAIYDGWVLMNQGHDVKIFPGEGYSYDMFTEYIECETNVDKAMRVAKSVRVKISEYAYSMVYHASMHFDKNRADAIFEFLKVGYKTGGSVTRRLADPVVMRIMELDRKTGNEAHLFREFLRFREIDGKILYGKIEPKCDVIPLMINHFANRYPLENWIIYDEYHKKAAVHKSEDKTIIVSGNELEKIVSKMEIDDEYEELWKVFFKTIGIESRYNPRCQQTMMPQWYRKNMTEFEDKNKQAK